jgi:hypothetical protein
MKPKFLLAASIAGTIASIVAFAGAADYAFEPVSAEVEKGDSVTITVRLIHKPTGKSVPDAVIFSPRIDMSPEGMETMTAPLTPTAGPEPGTYAFKTDLVMAGRWLFTLSAKVQGEPETVKGKVTFKAMD